jgi:hypothetical protein
MSASRILSVVLLCSVAACGSRHGSPAGEMPLADHTALSELDGFGIATRLSFNGRSAWFIIDTGAGVHTFAHWFVEAAELPLDRPSGGISVRDATGTPVNLRMVRNLTGFLGGGAKLALPAVTVANFPPEFEEVGIGGLLNPQLLAPVDGAVVLDLRTSEIRIEPFDAAVHRLGARAVPANELRVCRSTAMDVPNLLFALLVRANGEEGWLHLDTGAMTTKLAAQSSLARDLVLHEGGKSMGIAGQLQEYRRVRDLTLAFGGHEAKIDADVAASTGEGCGPDGLLGLDAVGRCAIVMSPDQLALACRER